MINFSDANTLDELNQMWRDARAETPTDIAQLNAEYSAYKRAILERNKEVGPIVNKLQPIHIEDNVYFTDKLHIHLENDKLNFGLQVSSIAFKSTDTSISEGTFSFKATDSGYSFSC